MPDAIPDEEAWHAWHPAELARRLAGVGRPWCVVGGWALDLWHGRETREHHDLEFTILREDFERFRRVLVGMTFYTVNLGTFELLLEGAEPVFSISQIWCWDIDAARWRVDMMIEPGTAKTWIASAIPPSPVRAPRSSDCQHRACPISGYRRPAAQGQAPATRGRSGFRYGAAEARRRREGVVQMLPGPALSGP